MISVIVPVYNVEKFLQECIDSILAQEYRDFELILVDDGSTDASPSICDEYAAKHPNIRVIHQPNQGASKARNAGMRKALGEYICFVDSDDTVSPSYLQAMFSAAAPGIDLVVQGLYHSEGETIICGKSFPDARYDSSCEALANGLLHFRGPVCKLFRRDLILKKGITFPPHIVYGEDAVFFYHYLTICKAIAFVSHCGYFYRKDPRNSVSTRLHEPTALLDYHESALGYIKEIFANHDKKSPLPDYSTIIELKSVLANAIAKEYTPARFAELINRMRDSSVLHFHLRQCASLKDVLFWLSVYILPPYLSYKLLRH